MEQCSSFDRFHVINILHHFHLVITNPTFPDFHIIKSSSRKWILSPLGYHLTLPLKMSTYWLHSFLSLSFHQYFPYCWIFFNSSWSPTTFFHVEKQYVNQITNKILTLYSNHHDNFLINIIMIHLHLNLHSCIRMLKGRTWLPSYHCILMLIQESFRISSILE